MENFSEIGLSSENISQRLTTNEDLAEKQFVDRSRRQMAGKTSPRYADSPLIKSENVANFVNHPYDDDDDTDKLPKHLHLLPPFYYRLFSEKTILPSSYSLYNPLSSPPLSMVDEISHRQQQCPIAICSWSVRSDDPTSVNNNNNNNEHKRIQSANESIQNCRYSDENIEPLDLSVNCRL